MIILNRRKLKSALLKVFLWRCDDMDHGSIMKYKAALLLAVAMFAASHTVAFSKPAGSKNSSGYEAQTEAETEEISEAQTEAETEEVSEVETETEADAISKTDPDTDSLPEQILGKALKKGDCIGITAPAGFIQDNDYNQVLLFLKDMGYEVKLADSCFMADGLFAGSDEERAADLNAFFEDDSVDAILCLRGGYGCARILEYLDYEMIKKHPKLLIGYSDITALHTALIERCGLVTVHGPMVSSFRTIYTDYVECLLRDKVSSDEILDGYDLSESDLFDLDESSFKGFPMEFTVTQFLKGIRSDEAVGEIELPEGGSLKTVVPGTAEGRIVGGNLTVLASLIGTEYELQGDHAILFIEEVSEAAYSVDRMLQQLYQNGLFDRVDGIMIGDMSTNYDDENRSCEEVIEEYARLAGKPCISGVPAGHGDDNMYLPLNVDARLVAEEDGTASLTILEPAAESAGS